ncbi:MAG: formyltransferase family protein [Patescibacteria group bacterium]|jgi:phosphoribosylglycinamide formyltransferase-1
MRIAMLISGGGTTMAAILIAVKNGRLKNVEPVLVIASKPDSQGIEKALNLGMPKEDVIVVKPKDFKTREEFGQKIIDECKKRNVKFIGQYGWLCLTPENVIKEFEGMIVNQHPGPLDPGRPDFGGKGMFGRAVHSARLEFVHRTNRDYWTEATAHRVTAEYDRGAVLNIVKVLIEKDDDVDALQQRVLPFEYEAQIKTLQDFADGNIKEIIRAEPLVRPEEYEILEECKKLAIEKYPKG